MSEYIFTKPGHSFKDLTGKKVNRLTFIKYVGWKLSMNGKYKTYYWECKCDCGQMKITIANSVLQNSVKSCGCLYSEVSGTHSRKHGANKRKVMEPEYYTWLAMKQRCFNPNNKMYRNYGARGITVCDSWRHDYVAFLRDMGKRPSSGHSIDRIDNDKGYSKNNCRWATQKEQLRNTRFSRKVTFQGKIITVADLADVINVNYNKVYAKIYSGYSGDDTVVFFLSRRRHAIAYK